jgi:hypothetical protein
MKKGGRMNGALNSAYAVTILAADTLKSEATSETDHTQK